MDPGAVLVLQHPKLCTEDQALASKHDQGTIMVSWDAHNMASLAHLLHFLFSLSSTSWAFLLTLSCFLKLTFLSSVVSGMHLSTGACWSFILLTTESYSGASFNHGSIIVFLITAFTLLAHHLWGLQGLITALHITWSSMLAIFLLHSIINTGTCNEVKHLLLMVYSQPSHGRVKACTHTWQQH
jgi:hypothetical protein